MLIHKASVRSASLRFRHPALTEELEIVLREVQHLRDQVDRLVVSAQAVLEGRQLVIDAHIGPFPELAVAGAVDFDVTVAGQLATFTAAGRSSWLGQFQDSELKVGLSVLAKSLWERWIGVRRICEKVAEDAVKIRRKRDPGTVPDLKQLLAGTYKPGSEYPGVSEKKEQVDESNSILDEL